MLTRKELKEMADRIIRQNRWRKPKKKPVDIPVKKCYIV